MCDCGQESPDPVELYSEGTVVCRACGVVMRDVVFERGGWSDHHGPPENPVPHNRHIDKLARALRLSEHHIVIETAKMMYGEVESRRALRESNGKLSKDAFAMACVYLAFKANGCPRSIRDFSKEAVPAIKVVQDVLGGTAYGAKLRDPTQANDLLMRCLSGVAAMAELSFEQRRALSEASHAVYARVEESGCLEGRTPEAVAAGVILAATETAKVAVPKKIIHEACGVSCVTMNKAHADVVA